MRILHTADLHIGKALEGQSRELEQRQVLGEITDIIRDRQVDLLLIAGDVFDVFNPSAVAEEIYYDFLIKVKSASGGRCGIVIIAGNHDQPQRLGAAQGFAVKQGVYVVTLPGGELPLSTGEVCPKLVASGAGWLELSWEPAMALPNVVVAALPYVSEGRMGQLISGDLALEGESRSDYSSCIRNLLAQAGAGFRSDTVNVVMAHMFMVGGESTDSERSIQVGGSFGVSTDVFPEQTQYVALGHLHRPQQIRGKVPCYYSGSPLACGFGECNQVKQVNLIEVEPESEARVEQIPLKSGFILQQQNFDSYEAAKLWCSLEENHDNWLNVRLKSAKPLTDQEIKDLRNAHPRLLRLEVDLPGVDNTAVATLEKLSLGDKFTLFAGEKLGAEPEPDLVRLFLRLAESDGELDFRDNLGEVNNDTN